MGIFDESKVEAGHRRLASSISAQTEVLVATTDLIRKALIHEYKPRNDRDEDANYLAIFTLGSRVINNIGATIKLLECGYFTQAASFCRDLAEIGMLALYFAEKPTELAAWRKAEGKRRYNKFGRSNLKTESNKIKFDFLNERFDLFSEYGAHPSAISLIAHHDGTKFDIFPHFDERLYIDTFKDLAFLSWHVTDACGDAYRAFFDSDLDDIFPKEMARFVTSWNGISD